MFEVFKASTYMTQLTQVELRAATDDWEYRFGLAKNRDWTVY